MISFRITKSPEETARWRENSAARYGRSRVRTRLIGDEFKLDANAAGLNSLAYDSILLAAHGGELLYEPPYQVSQRGFFGMLEEGSAPFMIVFVRDSLTTEFDHFECTPVSLFDLERGSYWKSGSDMKTAIERGVFYLGGNQPALLSVAIVLLSLLANEFPTNSQITLDEHNGLADGSKPISITKIS